MNNLRQMFSALVCVVIISVLSGCGPVSLLPLPDPEPAARGFFEAYFSGDSAAVSDLTCSYDSVLLKWEGEGEYYDKMHSLLIDSYSCDIDGAAEVKGTTAHLPVSITVFDFRLLEEPLTQRATDIALDGRKAGETKYENEDEIMSLLSDALTQVTRYPKKYCVTVPYNIELSYIDGRWLVVMDDELLRLLNGYAF